MPFRPPGRVWGRILGLFGDIECRFGSRWGPRGSFWPSLPDFWRPFAPLWGALWRTLGDFGALWFPFGRLWEALGAFWGHFWHLEASLGTLFPGKGVGPGFSLCCSGPLAFHRPPLEGGTADSFPRFFSPFWNWSLFEALDFS